MAKLTRRGLIRQTTIGTAAAGALLIAPGGVFAHNGTTQTTSGPRTLANDTPIDLHEPLGAYVHDFATGEITILLGSREVVVHDPELVRRLALAAR